METDSTLRDVRPAYAGPTSRLMQRFGTVVLLLIVVAGASGWLGVHSTQTSVTNKGYVLTVVYPKVARAGLDAPLRVRVHHPGGFPAALSIAVSIDYFRMWETQGFFPNPESATDDGQMYVMTFGRPAGDDFELDYDAYIQPSAQLGKGGHVQVLVGGTMVAQTGIYTWLAP